MQANQHFKAVDPGRFCAFNHPRHAHRPGRHESRLLAELSHLCGLGRERYLSFWSTETTHTRQLLYRTDSQRAYKSIRHAPPLEPDLQQQQPTDSKHHIRSQAFPVTETILSQSKVCVGVPAAKQHKVYCQRVRDLVIGNTDPLKVNPDAQLFGTATTPLLSPAQAQDSFLVRWGAYGLLSYLGLRVLGSCLLFGGVTLASVLDRHLLLTPSVWCAALFSLRRWPLISSAAITQNPPSISHRRETLT